jgi:hypothetical protein
MRRIEQEGSAAFRRLKRLERRVEFVLDFRHEA